MQSASSAQRLEEKFGEEGEAVRVNANLSDHLAEIFSIIFKDPQHGSRNLSHRASISAVECLASAFSVLI